jgi:hypothetical protein
MTNHLTKFKNLKDQTTTVGVTMRDSELVTITLNSLAKFNKEFLTTLNIIMQSFI